MRLAAGVLASCCYIAVPFAQGQKPLSYLAQHVSAGPAIDGDLKDPVWQQAAWTSDFIDITGDVSMPPRYRTRMKMLWDDKNLYIAAELQEPNVHGKLTQHDSVIFHDNDFELFLKPNPEAEGYFEFEMNALNTTWDLYLNKPYRLGGKPDNSWEAIGLKSAVAVQGTLNKADDKDQGWTVEIAIPWSAFASRQTVAAPADGTVWRVNFSRVEWLADHPREDNWVWSPQVEVNMHIPEHWGYLTFRK